MRNKANDNRLDTAKKLVTVSRRPNSRTKTNVSVGRGNPDREMLSAAIREWIVPLLVRDFLVEHSPVAGNTAVKSRSRTTGLHGEEGAGSTRI